MFSFCYCVSLEFIFHIELKHCLLFFSKTNPVTVPHGKCYIGAWLCVCVSAYCVIFLKLDMYDNANPDAQTGEEAKKTAWFT